MSAEMNGLKPVICVVIPSYKVRKHIVTVMQSIGAESGGIYVVDDKCPEGIEVLVQAQYADPRVTVLRHAESKGVGLLVTSPRRTTWAA